MAIPSGPIFEETIFILISPAMIDKDWEIDV